MPLQQTINFDNSYAEQLEGFYVPLPGEAAPDPHIVQFNQPLALELGLKPADFEGSDGAAFFTGGKMPEGAAPLAQVYAGHQFGGFSQQLGDGRALLIGEVVDVHGNRRDIQLKGSGLTPFSRGGDGKAVLGPVLREYLMGEAMHALGIPTTRALAAATTGEQVARESFQPGAILTRVASSHLRVGTFQFFAARGESDKLRKLADYAIWRHYPQCEEDENPYLSLLQKVIDRQASLIAKWMSVGFVHGVMNTDNMTISGETIDYGPCAFIDAYDPQTVFSSIDEQGRYAFGNQPSIAQWNLARFAETLLPLIDPDDNENAVRQATDAINSFEESYQDYRISEMYAKLGLTDKREGDAELFEELLGAMEQHSIDNTQWFRRLADAARGDEKGVRGLFPSASELNMWLPKWFTRLDDADRPREDAAAAMDAMNPLYIPRNNKVEEALQAAMNEADYAPFKKLLSVLEAPYTRQSGLEEFEQPTPVEFGKYRTFCGT